jgi:hypothetical protein
MLLSGQCKIAVMAPMEKSYYMITWRLAFFELLKSLNHDNVAALDEPQLERLLIAITQGGFGADPIIETVQVKERFLEFICQDLDIELPRAVDAFDEYFELIEPDFFIDLDEAS